MLLAIDTATRFIGLALHDGKNLIAEETWQTANNHTIQLAPGVFRMMEQNEVEIEALTALAVSIGPGSYTGLRIGVSLAKGMASARKLPLVGITTLDTIAAGQPNYQSGSGLVAVVQAGRGRVIVRTYKWRKGQWAGRGEPQLMNWESLVNNIDGPAVITGEITDEGFEVLAAAQAKDLPITIMPGAYRLRRAGFLAESAWEQLKNTEDKSIFAPARLTPLYVKSEDPV